jgi:hypothetical protein
VCVFAFFPFCSSISWQHLSLTIFN